MLEEPTIQLEEIDANLKEENVVLTIAVRNPTDRTLYAYASPRRIEYDPSTRKLTVALHDQHIGPDHPMAPHLPHPRIEPLEAEGVTPVAVQLPPVVRRVRSAAERTSGEPMVEVWEITEATEVTVEVAHQDTPYYYNPHVDKEAQLKRWGGQIARKTSRVKIVPPRRPPDAELDG